MKPERRKFKCEGCGKDRPCFAETNQEPSSITFIEEDLKCILDETNQTGYDWVEVPLEENKAKCCQFKASCLRFVNKGQTRQDNSKAENTSNTNQAPNNQ